jgi:hypothetical protein
VTATDFAARLHGREYGHEIILAEDKDACRLGLVVLFGYSDDNAEFRGAITDEVGCYNGGELRVHRKGTLDPHDSACDCKFCGFKAAVEKCATITAVWCQDGYSWTYRTDIQHATFDILEDGEKFCRGIVFNVADLPIL